MLTKKQEELLNDMCLGANTVQLGTLLLELQEKMAEGTIIWYDFGDPKTESPKIENTK